MVVNGWCRKGIHLKPAIWVEEYGRDKKEKQELFWPLLLKTRGTSLNDESLHNLLIEVEAIINSHSLTINLLSDVNSMIWLSLINLLTLKLRVMMLLSGVCVALDIYCCEHWRRVQHISDECWRRWRKEVLSTIQCRQKWNAIRKNCKVGDVVILQEAAAEQNSWPIVKTVTTNADRNGFVRSVKLMLDTPGTTDMALQYLVRPVMTLVMLVENKWLQWRNDNILNSIPRQRTFLWMIENF